MPETPSPPKPTPPSPIPPPEPLPPNPPVPPTGRMRSYFAGGNKNRSAGSTRAAQAPSL